MNAPIRTAPRFDPLNEDAQTEVNFPGSRTITASILIREIGYNSRQKLCAMIEVLVEGAGRTPSVSTLEAPLSGYDILAGYQEAKAAASRSFSALGDNDFKLLSLKNEGSGKFTAGLEIKPAGHMRGQQVLMISVEVTADDIPGAVVEINVIAKRIGALLAEAEVQG